MTLARVAAAAAVRREPLRNRPYRLASLLCRSLSSAGAASTHSSAKAAPPILLAVAAASIAVVAVQSAQKPDPALCHCQVPCGIFDDPVRVTLIREHAATISKASAQIRRIASSSAPSGEQFGAQSMNQAARWVSVKDQAAGEIITIVAEYFLCQRVKKENYASSNEYLRALEVHHALMQAAMKCKQTIDPAACVALEGAIRDVAAMYAK